MTLPDPAGAIPAATVIIARDGSQGLEVLVIERHQAMGFAGGAIVFPGGKVDPSDKPDGKAFHGFAQLDRNDALGRVSAAREAFEEAAILLSRGPYIPAEIRIELRRASDRHEIAFGDLLNQIGHHFSADTLVPFARWLPPTGLHKRFDTRFYLALLPEGEEMLADGHEAVHARWATPAELLSDADAGRISLLFPTRCNIARLAKFRSAASLFGDPTPPPFVQPIVSEDGWLTIPDDVGYPYVREKLELARRS